MSVSIVFASSESPVRCGLMRFCISVVEEVSGSALTVSVPWFGILSQPNHGKSQGMSVPPHTENTNTVLFLCPRKNQKLPGDLVS